MEFDAPATRGVKISSGAARLSYRFLTGCVFSAILSQILTKSLIFA
nr:hypothetical protein [Candidatus Njordarchaeota archaeon]